MNKEECIKCKHNRNCFIRSTVGDNTCLKLKEQDQEIDRLNNIINEIKEYLKYQVENLDFEKDTKAKMLGSMILVMLDKEELKEGNK